VNLAGTPPPPRPRAGGAFGVLTKTRPRVKKFAHPPGQPGRLPAARLAEFVGVIRRCGARTRVEALAMMLNRLGVRGGELPGGVPIELA
jgi:hypothetical protein